MTPLTQTQYSKNLKVQRPWGQSSLEQAQEEMSALAGQTAQEHPRGAHILIVYKAEIINGELKPADDVDRARFFSKDCF